MKNLATILSFIISFTIILSCKQATSSDEDTKKTDKDSITTNEDTIPTDTTTIIEDNLEDKNKKLDANLVLKDKLIKEKIIKKGYKYSITRISSFRNQKENDLLPLSAKNSFHLLGKALDVIVWDINNDYRVNLKDVDLFISIIKEVKAENKALVGGIGTYKNNRLSQQMVHFDTRGYAAYWNY